MDWFGNKKKKIGINNEQDCITVPRYDISVTEEIRVCDPTTGNESQINN